MDGCSRNGRIRVRRSRRSIVAISGLSTPILVGDWHKWRESATGGDQQFSEKVLGERVQRKPDEARARLMLETPKFESIPSPECLLIRFVFDEENVGST